MSTISYGDGSDVGRVRELNEDRYYADSELGLWLVADGMGGHRGGDVASTIASATVVEAIRTGRSLSEAIQLAHDEVLAAGERGEGAPNMGSTIVALRVQHHRNYEIAWVGDSRAYLWDGQLHQLSRDHSYVQWLVDRGEITEEQARKHPKSNVITQALGVRGQSIRVDCRNGALEQGQKILLCSDGLNGEVSDTEISKIMMSDGSEQSLVDRLIETALQRGGRDNVSVLVISAPSGSLGVADEDTELLSTQELIFPRFNRRRKRLWLLAFGVCTCVALALVSLWGW
ncbi:MAG: PP2C family serine/threonine-protein phosphatase [Motiliproteus sp.]